MGYTQANEPPALICFYETGNEDQKNYCIKFKTVIESSGANFL